MKRHNSKTRNSEISNTNYVSATCRPRLNRKCKLLDEDKPDKKTEPLLITKEKTLANVKLLPIKKKRKTAVLDLAEILKLDLERSSVADKLQPSFGLTRLNFSFYDVLCEELAKSLLGKILVRHLDDGTVLKGRIVETECYLGGIDKASQSYNGKITERNIPMYMRPGTCYVYLTYGMYHCFNISSQGAGAAVLLRALEPLEGLDYMQEQRQKKRKPLQSSDLSEEKPSVKQNKLLKPHELCNGPAKLYLKIVKRFYMTTQQIVEKDCPKCSSSMETSNKNVIITSNYFSTFNRVKPNKNCKIDHDSNTVVQLTKPQKESLFVIQEEVSTRAKLLPTKKKRKAAAFVSTAISNSELKESCQSSKVEPYFGLKRLNYSFYDVPCEELAKSLLGKVLVRRLDDGTVLKGRIMETESYLGGNDAASHSYNGKITERNTPMYMKPGTCYVYFTYGMYHCFNISSQGAGAAVLLRALEPLAGLDYMQYQRQKKRKSRKSSDLSEEKSSVTQNKLLKVHELCNGPAKLCICLDIDKSNCNKQDLCDWNGMWVETDELSDKVKPHHIVSSTRIGINSVGIEWASKPLRFYVFGNKCVSRLDKGKEQELKQLYDMLLRS